MLFNCVVIIEKIYKNRQHTSCPHFQNLLPPGVNPVTSTNILGVSMLVQPVETRQNPSRPVETRRNMLQPVETRFNPFRSVQTRLNLNLSKHVQTCWNTLQSVQTRFPSLPLLPPPPFPLSFFFGGGKGRGEGGGGRGEGGGALPWPPLRILTKNYQNSLTLSSLCVIYPRGFSQSTAQNYINTYGGLSTKNKIHCGILKWYEI